MASVTLTEMWLHLAADLSQHVRVEVFGGLSAPARVQGDVRARAGGRRQMVRRKGRHKSVTATFPAQRDVIAQLEEWTGEIVMFRDPVGRLLFGVYFDLGQDEIDGGEWVMVDLFIDEVTFDIAA